jgi:AraC family transcriptional regulator
MSVVEKALWYIETHLRTETSLSDIAGSCDVSRYHLLRALGAATGVSAMSYVRGRRLTEAARQLASGADDILDVALDAGYSSHEAFTRAFRDQFGLTPEAVRAQAHTQNLNLVEPIRMNETLIVDLDRPRLENRRAFLVAGLGQRYRFETNEGIPFLWQRFVPYIGNVPGQAGGETYGLCCNNDGKGNFDYVAGVEVSSFDDVQKELTRIRVPEQRYAVFTHRGHISTIRATVYTIWNKWLPSSGLQTADGPDFELYSADFDPRAGTGTLEIWVPIKEGKDAAAQR